jgi:hypothetical protein
MATDGKFEVFNISIGFKVGRQSRIFQLRADR